MGSRTPTSGMNADDRPASHEQAVSVSSGHTGDGLRRATRQGRHVRSNHSDHAVLVTSVCGMVCKSGKLGVGLLRSASLRHCLGGHQWNHPPRRVRPIAKRGGTFGIGQGGLGVARCEYRFEVEMKLVSSPSVSPRRPQSTAARTLGSESATSRASSPRACGTREDGA